MTERESQLEGLIQSALSSMEMRHERGFNLMVPLEWIERAHEVIYSGGSETICTQRINAARNRMEAIK